MTESIDELEKTQILMIPREDAIEIRSEEFQDVIGMMPHWIISWGITVIAVVFALMLAGSYLFKYPDVVNATVIVTTKNPPATLVARISGKIQHLLVKDNQRVNKGTYVAVLENAANFNHVQELQWKLDRFRPYLSDFSTGKLVAFSRGYILGELQNPYEVFLKNLSDYLHFLLLDYFGKKVRSLEEQLEKNNAYCQQISNQVNITEEEWQLAKNQYDRVNSLFLEGIISKTDLENARGVFLQKKNALEAAKTSFLQAKIQVSQLEQNIMDLKLQDEQQKKQLQLVLKQGYDNLASAILQWEQNYVLKTPISGNVTFNSIWNVNQNVVAGDKVVSIVPPEKTEIIGRMILPIQGSGKVKPGQKVRIRFDNYPYMEFGQVWGEIRTKSLIPMNSQYSLEVSLPRGLHTSYGKTLDFTQEMQGTAEIITENRRLISRFFAPLKQLLSQNRGN